MSLYPSDVLKMAVVAPSLATILFIGIFLLVIGNQQLVTILQLVAFLNILVRMQMVMFLVKQWQTRAASTSQNSVSLVDSSLDISDIKLLGATLLLALTACSAMPKSQVQFVKDSVS
jgi:hypothetical protein